MCTGEYMKIPKKNPTHTEVHIMQDNISDMNLKTPSKGNATSPKYLMKFLGVLKMVP